MRLVKFELVTALALGAAATRMPAAVRVGRDAVLLVRLHYQDGSGPLKMKKAPPQIRAKPTRWFEVMRSPR